MDDTENPVDPGERAAIVFMEWLEAGGNDNATEAVIASVWKGLSARGLVPVKSVPRNYIKSLRARFPERWMEARRAWRQERFEKLEDRAISTLEGIMDSKDMVQSRLASNNILGHIRQMSGEGPEDGAVGDPMVDSIIPNPNVERQDLKRQLQVVGGGGDEGG